MELELAPGVVEQRSGEIGHCLALGLRGLFQEVLEVVLLKALSFVRALNGARDYELLDKLLAGRQVRLRLGLEPRDKAGHFLKLHDAQSQGIAGVAAGRAPNVEIRVLPAATEIM